MLAQPVSPDLAVPSGAERRRFAFGETVDPITLSPTLGDRIFVAMPDRPFFVLPDESVRAHLSLPLWVQVRLGRKQRLAIEMSPRRVPLPGRAHDALATPPDRTPPAGPLRGVPQEDHQIGLG